MTVAPPAEMTAIAIPTPGGPEALVPQRRAVPKPGPGELLVKVAAAGINRPDVLQRQGNYAPPPGATDIPGLEVAGEVAASGGETGAWRIGDKLCALVAGGGYAEYCLVPAPQALPVPRGLDLIQAAALPETFFTVWTNVFERGALKAGESFLVHGGTSGIGTTAIQLAAQLGARVFATAGGPDKVAACRSLGAERAIDYRSEDFVTAVLDATGGKGVDVILDMVGGDYFARNMKCLALEGRIVQIAFLKGSKVELDLAPLMVKRQTLTGSTLRPRSVAEKGAIAKALKDRVWPLIEAGRVQPVIHKTFPLAQAAAAHRLMESSAHIGKIVLTV
ncbi:MAG TPA: NAD(P)H-quinone oxidoreductase [Hypericibacter adhaerens]|jgi:putative PIG3 family NAD(P)H quinone oxidoreductase|uniref:NAD(P)H quinone oxidoreductase n=1 Tax=Hypericibacter adhaerens TaxID=2602016 RepID=A0A5J6N3Q8_9PROT|nr:NAD(P)H-quinone oxidoreductase [Hypericibacter adhaerens]QEX24034.1 NAD(P)H quinone oxidoreductase [Hypericibacter adhaerens]HWA44811.1 NAD(P)H-quinone oxidoreductase [Hypericibacter adhaerens]